MPARLIAIAALAVLLSLASLAGCWTNADLPAAAPRPALLVRRAPYALTPKQLGDAGAVASIAHHARLERAGRAWTDLDRPSVQRDPDDLLVRPPVVPVIDERGDRVRVVFESDDARLALWVERRSLATTTIAPIELTDERGRASSADGIWLDAGADLAAAAPATESGLRAVELRDDDLAVRGYAPAAALGPIWVGDAPREPLAPADSPISLAPHAIVRAAPDGAAPVLAEVTSWIGARELGRRGAWREIEIARPAVRVRGFVFASAVHPLDFGHSTSFLRSGWGMDNVTKLPVPAGACLFPARDGDVIGVNTADRVRYQSAVHDDWHDIYVATELWGEIQVTVHVTPGAGSAMAMCSLTSR